jgi:membrane-bound lytic murein transglycosylase B
MQFSIPPHFDTWGTYGVDGDGDGVRDVYDPADAIPSAANLLAANGAAADLPRAIYTYNHSQTYVDAVLELAASYAEGGDGDARALATAEDAAIASDDETAGFSAVALW